MKKIVLGSLALVSFANATLIYPIPVKVEKNKAVLTVEDNNTKYQATLYRWIQEDGKDKLIPVSEDEAIVYPPLFKAGKKRLKIVLLKNDDRKTEKAYRIVLEELQTHKAKINGSMINIKKMFSIPVFVLPKEDKTNFKLKCDGNKLVVENTGNKHLKVLFINDKQVNSYILPENKKSFEIAKKQGTIRFANLPITDYQCE